MPDTEPGFGRIQSPWFPWTVGTTMWPKSHPKDFRLLVLLPDACSPAHRSKVPNRNIARRLVLLESLSSAHLKMV